MRIHEREEGRPRRGDRVHAFAAGKDGWGVVEAVVDGGVHVHFPEVPYPQTLAQPTGDYFVPWERIVKVERAAAPALPGESPTVNTASDKHPHELGIPPTIDPEGRCLVCGLLVERDRWQEEARRCAAASDALRKAALRLVENAVYIDLTTIGWTSMGMHRSDFDALRAALGDEGAQR